MVLANVRISACGMEREVKVSAENVGSVKRLQEDFVKNFTSGQ
jgi:hypothetical protein